MFIVRSLLYVIAPANIVRHIFRRNVVDGQTVLEAIAGQLFLVTAVAKVVTSWRTPAERRAERGSRRRSLRRE
jgi:hypothetical protein